MAKVHAQAQGGSIKEIEAATVNDVKIALGCEGWTALVNGNVEDDDYELRDYEFVSLAQPVKGGI